jgi:hypothetical protein
MGSAVPAAMAMGKGWSMAGDSSAISVGTAATRPCSRRGVCCGPPEPANVTAQPEQAWPFSPTVLDAEWWAIQPWRFQEGPWPFIQSLPPTPVVVAAGIELDPENEHDDD